MAAVRDALQRKLDAGMQHHRAGDFARAETSYRNVLARDPRHLTALHLLGAVLLERGRDADAIKVLRTGAAAPSPAQALFLANLGEALRRTGDHEEAVACLRRATALQPGLAEAHFTLGLILQATDRLSEAIACFRAAIGRKPGLLPAHVRLAESLQNLELVDEALEAWTGVLRLDPSSADACDGIGMSLREQGRSDEAIAAFRRALELRPDHALAHSHLVYTMNLTPGIEAPSILAEAVRWRDRHANASGREARWRGRDRDPDRVLRVGYLSPDFRNHSHALFLTPLLERHDRRSVRVYAYSLAPKDDTFTERFRGLVDEYRDVSRHADAEIVDAIVADGIDVLVDVTMHLAGNRLRIFASRPAPVQVTWLAYPGTTGLNAIDYRLTDPFLDPPAVDLEPRYAERSVRLPDTFWCYDPLTREPEVTPLPALREGRITFGALNRFNKTNPGLFDAWSRVLHAVPGSRMILLAWPGESRRRALEAMARGGITGERIEFVGYASRAAYFALYRRIDVSLDTFPHNGGATSLDSFWMGVPVVTLVGQTPVGRAGLCFASNLGLETLVANDASEFVRAAVDVCSDLDCLAHLRAELRGRMESSPLMDAPRFAKAFEDALREMWRGFCASP